LLDHLISNGLLSSRLCDHWLCPKQHLQRAQHRSADGRSKFVRDDLVDVSIPVCHLVCDWHRCWQPDEVSLLYALVLILADDMHEIHLSWILLQMLYSFIAESSGTNQQTSIFHQDVISMTSEKPRVSVCQTLLGSRFLHDTVGWRWQWVVQLQLSAQTESWLLPYWQLTHDTWGKTNISEHLWCVMTAWASQMMGHWNHDVDLQLADPSGAWTM